MANKDRITIGVLIELLEGNYQSIVWPGIVETARENNCNLVLFPGKEYRKTDISDYQHKVVYNFINKEKIDGLVCTSSVFTNYYGVEGALEFFKQFEPIPMAHMGMEIEGSIGVVIENKQGICEIVEHLIEVHQYRKIAFLQGPMYNNESIERFEGYKETLAKYEIPFDPELVVEGDFLPPSGKAAVDILLDERKLMPDAIVASNDEMALGAYEALKQRKLDSPRDIAITGFDAIDQARYHIPSLTTIKAPLFEQAKITTQLLINQIQGANVPNRIKLPTKLIIRQTCGCVYQTAVGNFREFSPVKSSSFDEDIHRKSEKLLIDTLDKMASEPDISEKDPDNIESLKGVFRIIFDQNIEFNNRLNKFAYALSCLLISKIKEDDDVEHWLQLLNRFQIEIFNEVESNIQVEILEKTFQRSRLMLDEFRFLAKSEAADKLITQMSILSTVNNDLMTTFDINKLMEQVENTLPRLGIDQFFIALYEEPIAHDPNQEWIQPDYANLMLAYDKKERIDVDESAKKFSTVDIVPKGLNLTEPYALVLKSLFFEENQFGYLVMKMGHRDSMVYEIVRVQISSALRGSLLFNTEKQLRNELQKTFNQLKESNQFLKTNQERLEEKTQILYTTNQALTEAERKSRFLLEYSPDYIMAVDLDYRIEYINRSVNGKPVDAAAGEIFFDYVYEQLKNKLINLIETTLKSGNQVSFEEEIKEEKESIWFEYRLTPILNSEKAKVMIIARNITDRKKAELQLAEAQKELVTRAHQAGMADIATGALHNVGNVLNSVKTSNHAIKDVLNKSNLPSLKKTNIYFGDNIGQAEKFFVENNHGERLLEYYVMLNERLTQEWKLIKDQAGRLEDKIELIIQIIAAQQKYAGSTYLSDDESLEGIVNDAIVLQEESLNNYGVEIIKKFKSIPNIYIQKAKLIHILINIIKNAQDAMQGTPKEKRQIMVLMDADKNRVYLKFKDTGEGLKEEQLSLIFSHGYTTKENGYGFGLHSCANYMSEMNGSMWAESEGLGLGTTIILAFNIPKKSETAYIQ